MNNEATQLPLTQNSIRFMTKTIIWFVAGHYEAGLCMCLCVCVCVRIFLDFPVVYLCVPFRIPQHRLRRIFNAAATATKFHPPIKPEGQSNYMLRQDLFIKRDVLAPLVNRMVVNPRTKWHPSNTADVLLGLSLTSAIKDRQWHTWFWEAGHYH